MRRMIMAAAAALAFVGCRQVEETSNPVSDSLVGIGATAPADQTSTSAELSRVQFDDVPVPRGFFLRNHRNESYSYESGRMRIGRFVYWGRGKEEEVAAEYLEKMPKDPYNWTLKAGSREAEPLIFEKPGERCEIHLSRHRREAEDGLLITISVESN